MTAIWKIIAIWCGADRRSAKSGPAFAETRQTGKGAHKPSAYTLKQRVAAAEAALAAAQAELAQLDQLLADLSLFARDPAHAGALAKQRAVAAAALEQAEEAWLAASAELEA